MSLRALITQEQFNEADEAVQALYIKGDDDESYRLDVEPVGSLQLTDVSPLKSTLEKERNAHRAAQSKYEELHAKIGDIDIDAAKDALSKVAEMENWDPDEKLKQHKVQFEQQIAQRFEGNKKQLQEKHIKEVNTLKSEAQKLSLQLEKQLIVSTATAALARHEGNPALLVPIIRSQTQMVKDEDGTIKVVVLNAAGEPRVSPKGGSTDPMTIEELVEEMKTHPDYGMGFKSKAKGGGGGPGADRNLGAKNPWSLEHFNLTEQARILKENPGLANQLKSAAGV